MKKVYAGIPLWGWLASGGLAAVLGLKWYQKKKASSSSGVVSTTTTAGLPPAVQTAQTNLSLPGGVSYQGPPWGLDKLLSTDPVSATTPAGATYQGPGGELLAFLNAIAPPPAPPAGQLQPPPVSSVPQSQPTSYVPPSSTEGSPVAAAPVPVNPTSYPGYGAGLGDLVNNNPGILQNTSPTPTPQDPYPATYNGVPINVGGGT